MLRVNSRIGRFCGLCGFWRSIMLLSVAVALATTIGTTSSLASDGCLLREQDDAWLISTRHLGCFEATDVETPDYQVERYVADQGWQSSGLDELLSPDSTERLLVIYVHGNRVQAGEAVSQGWCTYQSLMSTIDDTPAIRFVTWSWPSSRIRGQIRDVRCKAQRTEVDSYLLGRVLSRIPPEQTPALIGFSFGARVITGALHLAGGGELSYGPLASAQGDGCRTRVAFFAAAIHNSWLNPCGYHEMAFRRVDSLLNLYNSCDPALRRYKALDRRSKPTAIGYTGMYVGDLGEQAESVKQLNVSCIVGRSHDESRYLGSFNLRQQVQDFFFRAK